MTQTIIFCISQTFNHCNGFTGFVSDELVTRPVCTPPLAYKYIYKYTVHLPFAVTAGYGRQHHAMEEAGKTNRRRDHST